MLYSVNVLQPPHSSPKGCMKRLAPLAFTALLLPTTVQAAQHATKHLDMVYLAVDKSATETKLGDYSTPDSGKVYLSVWVDATNHNDVQKRFSTSDLAVSVNGAAYDNAYTTPSPELKNTVLDPGASISGTITFQVPSGHHIAVFKWAPQSGYEEHWPVATWTIRY